MKTPKRIETPKRVEGNEMPSRPMNAEPPQPAAGGKASSSQKGDMPSRAMDEPEPSNSTRAMSPREQDKLAAYRRDQAARAAAAAKSEMPGAHKSTQWHGAPTSGERWPQGSTD